MTAANDITVPTFKMKRELRSVATNCVPLDLTDQKLDLPNFLPLMTTSKELYNSPGLESTQDFTYPKIDLHILHGFTTNDCCESHTLLANHNNQQRTKRKRR